MDVTFRLYIELGDGEGKLRTAGDVVRALRTVADRIEREQGNIDLVPADQTVPHGYRPLWYTRNIKDHGDVVGSYAVKGKGE